MPSIGPISFSVADGLDSGIALLLVKPPSEKIHARHGRYELLASPDAPHVVCRFHGATSESDAFARGVVTAQEGLDLLSILGRGDLVTRDAFDEHLLWWKEGELEFLSLVSTATLSIALGPVTITVRDADGNVVPPAPVGITHHLGFRFYRLAQASDDLFDAFRNMYLAFESLLSSRYAKGKQLEIDWLRNSLNAASSELELRTLLGPTVTDPVSHFLQVAYREARLPLFHAKDGRTYFAPSHDSTDREAVLKALDLLTRLVLRMADKWYAARRQSSWFNLSLLDEKNATLFGGSQFFYIDDSSIDMKREPDPAVLLGSLPFDATFHERFGGQVRHHVEGLLDTSILSSRGPLQAFYLARGKEPLVAFNSDTPVDVTGFDRLLVRLFVRSRNAGQPRYMYPR